MIPSQMLKGLLEGAILKIISRHETYAYEISEILNEYGFGDISEGTIYPMLLRLQKKGLIESVSRASSSGPNRKYYYLTSEGKEYGNEFTEQWHALTSAMQQLFEGGEDE